MRYYILFCVAGFMMITFATTSAQDLGALGQAGAASQKTDAPADARFEVIQTSSAIRTTLKLDKFTGTVYELVRSKDLVRAKDEEYVWAVTKRLPHTQDRTESTSEVNYQIVTTTTGVRYTFLVNVHTGASWKLTADPDKEASYWYPIKNQ